MTALADATDPRFTDGQRAHLARFEAAEVPAEVVEAVPHEHGRWCLTGCDTGGSEPLPPADLSRFSAPARVTAVDLDALDKLRGALAAAMASSARGNTYAQWAATILPVIVQFANERAAAELDAAIDEIGRDRDNCPNKVRRQGYGGALFVLKSRRAALDPT